MTPYMSVPIMLDTKNPQRGAALMTGLIFLVVLTLLTLSAIKATSLEERMAGNARDQDLAFQGAEAAIRDAMLNVVPTLNPGSAFAVGCAAGLCQTNSATPVWTTITNNNDWTTAKTAEFALGTAATPLSGVFAQPRYIIEYVQGVAAGTGDSGVIGVEPPTSAVISYRVTSRGWGFTPQANVTLQSTFNF